MLVALKKKTVNEFRYQVLTINVYTINTCYSHRNYYLIANFDAVYTDSKQKYIYIYRNGWENKKKRSGLKLLYYTA